MDIRKFFNKRKETNQSSNTVAKRHRSREESELDQVENFDEAPNVGTSQEEECLGPNFSSTAVNSDAVTLDRAEVELPTFERKDIGRFLNENERTKLTQNEKLEILTNPLELQPNYNFKSDVSLNQRPFLFSWLQTYAPWLTYSICARGALCLYCVLFPQPVRRGLQGAFIVRPFTKYRHFHDEAKAHMRTQWHKDATVDANNFVYHCKKPEENVAGLVDSNYRMIIESNRLKLCSLLKGILFCATHDIALRGKQADSGNLFDLYEFRAEAGDKVLQNHLETAPKNARYTSVQTQNDLIELTADVIRRDIVLQANASIAGFALIADETADVSGVEQFSIGIRFVSYANENVTIHEEFLGFSALKSMDAEAISTELLRATKKYGLDLQKMMAQGYDGCSTMAGEVSGVQKRIRNLYPKAYFMHCASHRLNLVINDQNKVVEIRNAIAVIKSVIVYFRESSARRQLVSHIPLLCETRWSEKYKSIRLFYKNFAEIFTKLEEIAHDRNQRYSSDSRQKALQLIHSLACSSFLVCLTIISKYSAMLEPVAQVLQSVNIDINSTQNQINALISVVNTHRDFF